MSCRQHIGGTSLRVRFYEFQGAITVENGQAK